MHNSIHTTCQSNLISVNLIDSCDTRHLYIVSLRKRTSLTSWGVLWIKTLMQEIISMEGNYRQKSMHLAFIRTFFILDAWLYVYMHVSCFHSYSSLFFILVCMLTRVYHVMDFLHTLIPVLFEFFPYSLLLF